MTGVEAQIALIVTTFVISMITSKTDTNKPEKATISDFDLPTPKEGTPQKVVFGDVWIKDWTVLTFGNLRTSSVRSKSGK